MAKAPKKSLLDDVLSRAHGNRPGFASWFDRLPPEAQSELSQVRESFDPAVHQKAAFAKAIIAACAERGWQTSGKQRVIAWLNKR